VKYSRATSVIKKVKLSWKS